MSQARTIKQVLTAAKWMIENVGWIKGSYAEYDDGSKLPTGFCSLGALNAVEANNRVKEQAQIHLYHTLHHALGVNDGVAYWQDNAVRTKEEVLAFFEKAIATIPAKGKKS
jgi:hypothetical protein